VRSTMFRWVAKCVLGAVAFWRQLPRFPGVRPSPRRPPTFRASAACPLQSPHNTTFRAEWPTLRAFRKMGSANVPLRWKSSGCAPRSPVAAQQNQLPGQQSGEPRKQCTRAAHIHVVVLLPRDLLMLAASRVDPRVAHVLSFAVKRLYRAHHYPIGGHDLKDRFSEGCYLVRWF